jgi:hypothetical protein
MWGLPLDMVEAQSGHRLSARQLADAQIRQHESKRPDKGLIQSRYVFKLQSQVD